MAILLGACARLGPTTLHVERNKYNLAVQRTNDEQLLLNLVRLKYRDTPLFLEVTSVTSQFTLKTSADASASLSSSRAGIFGLGAGVELSEKPTVSYTPLQGEKFIKQLLAPISMQSIALMYHSGWSIDRIFRLCLQRMSDLKNATGASGPTPERAPDFEDFARASKLLRFLHVRDAIDILHDPNQNPPGLILRIDPDAWELPEMRELAGLLKVEPGKNRYTLSTNPVLDAPNHVVVTPRSLLGVMFYLSQAVEVSLEDQKLGKVTRTVSVSGDPFDWSRVTGDLLNIKSQPGKPEQAAVSIYYRDSWFYIHDSDLNSKSTFSLLAQLFYLQAGDFKSIEPVLTLPVGN